MMSEEPHSYQNGKMEQVEITIHSNGIIETKVIGVKGEECLKVTEGLVEKLGGTVLNQEMTEEFYEREEKVMEDNSVYQQNYNEW